MSDIAFNEIPSTIRLPAALVEIDNSGAVTTDALQPYKNLIIGQKGATGTIAALTPTRVTNPNQVRELAGAGSLLALMAETQLKNNDFTETLIVALDDDAAGVAATGSITFGGTVTTAGTLYLYIAGRRVKVAVLAAQAPSAIATAVQAAIAANTDLPITAAVDGVTAEKVNLTARNKGECGNGIDVRVNYYDGESLPAGLTVTFSNGTGTVVGSPTPPWEWGAAVAGQVSYHANIDPARPFRTLVLETVLPPKESKGMRLSGGTGNPDIAPIWAALGETQYNIVTTPYLDTANLVSLEDELRDRWTGLRMIEGMAFTGAYGTHSALGTLGDSRNSPFLSIMAADGPFTFNENNLLLFDGISTHEVGADGKVRIWQVITTYKVNAVGAEDISYLKVNTILTLGYLRYDWRAVVNREFLAARHKLANDGKRYKPTQKVATPKTIKARAVAWLRAKEDQGLVENVDDAIARMVAGRNNQNPDRADLYLPPNIVNQFDILATQLGFVL